MKLSLYVKFHVLQPVYCHLAWQGHSKVRMTGVGEKQIITNKTDAICKAICLVLVGFLFVSAPGMTLQKQGKK